MEVKITLKWQLPVIVCSRRLLAFISTSRMKYSCSTIFFFFFFFHSGALAPAVQDDVFVGFKPVLSKLDFERWKCFCWLYHFQGKLYFYFKCKRGQI